MRMWKDFCFKIVMMGEKKYTIQNLQLMSAHSR